MSGTGKEYGHGRKALLECLDCLLAEQNNIQKIHDAWQESFDNDPVAFFETTVKALIPRAMLEAGIDSRDVDAAKLRELLHTMQDSIPAAPDESDEVPD